MKNSTWVDAASSVGEADSFFDQAVARGLRDRGWTVVPQIGVSRFRIGLGVVHPNRPGDCLIGIECDGASYHGAATARDREKVRGAVLNGLGWSLTRIGATDWWIDPQGALDRLDATLNEALERSRAKAAAAAIETTQEMAPDGLLDEDGAADDVEPSTEADDEP